jgi:hypothetical protein
MNEQTAQTVSIVEHSEMKLIGLPSVGLNEISKKFACAKLF